MRILFVTRKFPPSVGGMEMYSRHLLDAMVGQGAQVDLHKPRRDLMGRPTLPQMAAFFLSACSLLLLRGRRYDVVLLGDYAIASLAIVAKIATLGRLRTVVSLHGNDLYFMRKRTLLAALYRGLSRLVTTSRALDAAIANSNAIKDEAGTRGIAPAFVVPLATTVPARTPMSGQPRKRQLLFAGRLIRYKGLSWFMQHVWPHVDDTLELLVAGQVWDEAERECLRGQSRVTYLGILPYRELPALRAQVLACIMPNLPPGTTDQDEGFGIAALEGPAVGTPTLASRCGGLPDAVAQDITGFLLPPEDAMAWIDCVSGLAQWTPEQFTAFSAQARQHVLDNYNWNLVATRTLAVLAQDVHADATSSPQRGRANP